jgi:hypothetical protein
MDEEKNEGEEVTKIKGLGGIWWFAAFCAILAAGILYALGYMMAAGMAAPAVFLAITIPALMKQREFRKADRDEMFDFVYGKMCAHIIDSAGILLLALAIILYTFPDIPGYIALAFVGAVIYGDIFFRYLKLLRGK